MFLTFGDTTSLNIHFTITTSTNPESTLTPNIELTLSETYGSDVTVAYTISGLANSGTDYTLANGTATITTGETTTNIIPTIIDDNSVEDSETIILTLSDPTNAILGTNIVHTYTITDNDTAGITVTESSSSTDIEENATSDTYTIVLNTEPTNDVIITIAPDTQSITFTSANWDTAQAITITAVDDTDIEADHTSVITHTATSDDSNYDNISMTSITANITDNDFASGGLPVGSSNQPVSPEGGFRVVINNNDEFTNNSLVSLKLYVGSDTTRMAISDNPEFKYASIVPYQEGMEWNLFKNPPSPLFQRGNIYTIYAKFYTQYGVASEVVSDSIVYREMSSNQDQDLNQDQSNQDSLPNGSLVRAVNDFKVYIINAFYKRHIVDEIIFSFYDHLNKKDVIEISSSQLNNYEESYLIRADGDYKVYEIKNNKKYWLNISVEEFDRLGYKWDNEKIKFVN